jgi:long-subunit fatty acid transport protein
VIVLALLGLAHAASLDQIEVGGPWGTPTATDATALWWNPAGLAAGHGTRFQLEGAPVLATMNYDRADPNGRDGLSTYQRIGAIPFLGLVSDAGVEGLGFGAGVAVPTARGASMVLDSSTSPPSDGRYAMREGNNQAIHAIVAGAWQPHPVIAFGATGQLAMTEWQALLDSQLTTVYYDRVSAADQDPPYTDRTLEDPRYAATVAYSPLRDRAFTFSGGVHITPIERLAIALTWVNGYRVENTGDVKLYTECPPQADTFGRFVAETAGLCYAEIEATGKVAYNLPSRLQGGVSYETEGGTRLELMGAFVGWSVFDDYDVTMTDVASRNPDLPPETAAALDRTRKQARDAQNTYWAAVDVKHRLNDSWTVGGRALFDRAAVPDHAVSASNFDANAGLFSGLVAWKPTPNLEIGLSGTYHYLALRRVTDSAFGVAYDPGQRNEDRFFYPHTNGDYGSSIFRGGVQLRGQFGKEDYQRNLVFTGGPTPTPAEPTPVMEAPAPEAPVVVEVSAPGPDTTPEVDEPVQEQPGLRVVDTDLTRFPGRAERVAAADWGQAGVPRREVNPALSFAQQQSPAELLSRLWGAYGPPGEVRLAGFTYHFRDRETGLVFAARYLGTLPEYTAPAETLADPRFLPMLQEFDAWLAEQRPGDCELRYTTSAGRRVMGAYNGVAFDKPEPPGP